MKKRYFNLFFLFFLFWVHETYSQINCNVPLPPVLNLVSVQPETGYTEFEWTPSPSDSIAAYILYTFRDGDSFPIDTIWDPSARSFTISTPIPTSESFRITAYKLSEVAGFPGCVSPLSNVISTIFCSSEIDTCRRIITLRWNKYSDFPKHVKEYRILVSEDAGPLRELYTAGNNADNFTLSEFNTDREYCFAVRAILDDGEWSNSNESCLLTRMQHPPEWINADFATVNDQDQISLSFTVDPFSEISQFRLERKSSLADAFEIISQPVISGGKVTFTDEQADISSINYYRLSAVNSCQVPVTVSDTASNIVLSLEAANNDIFLTWNPPKWSGTSSYELFTNTGNGFVSLAMISADTAYKISMMDIMYQVTGGELCFYLNASEANNFHGINGKSRSSVICTSPVEIVTVPNVFTPNNDLLNDFFRPILSFTPSEYHLIISNRQGKTIFESRDFHEEWDGTMNGDQLPQGVFLWFLKLKTPSGKIISRTGTVTILKGN
jgi:gliding motility-associated-like protein